MTTNLMTDKCCGIQVKLEDLVGKPIEFRRCGRYAPQIGTRWDCPKCGTAYFVLWTHRPQFWGYEGRRQALNDNIRLPSGKVIPNRHKGRFIVEGEFGTPIETGVFELDLSYYESFRDEPVPDEEEKEAIRKGEKDPWHLCTGGAEDVQLGTD